MQLAVSNTSCIKSRNLKEDIRSGDPMNLSFVRANELPVFSSKRLSANVSFTLKSRCDVCLQKSDADCRLALPRCNRALAIQLRLQAVQLISTALQGLLSLVGNGPMCCESQRLRLV